MIWREDGKNRQKLCVGGQVFEKALKRACDALADSASVEGTEAHEHIAWPVYLHMIILTHYWSCITIDELRKTCIYE